MWRRKLWRKSGGAIAPLAPPVPTPMLQGSARRRLLFYIEQIILLPCGWFTYLALDLVSHSKTWRERVTIWTLSLITYLLIQNLSVSDYAAIYNRGIHNQHANIS